MRGMIGQTPTQAGCGDGNQATPIKQKDQIRQIASAARDWGAMILVMQPLNARTSSSMSKVRQVRTTPEERVAAALRELGKAYRRNVRNLPGRPDFANRSKGWAVQVHGCFWHQHDCKRGTVPINNREEWLIKFAANRARDQRVEADLRGLGLEVITVWECETRDHAALVERLANLR